MASFTALKTAIQNAIRQNGNEEITGDVLQQILLSVVNTMGDGAINTIEQNLSNETLARQGADNTLQSNIDAEALARGNTDTQLQNAINAIKANIDNGYVYAGIATPSSTPVSGKVFYIATVAGTYTNFGGQVLTQGINILRYNGSEWSNQQLIGIDDVPTAGSNNLLKSGGVQNELALGAVYDVSAKNPTGGPNNDGKWESLSALLSDANLNTLIPTAYRKGGMSIKFVHTSDNKYIQARCMAQSFTTDVTQWQVVDDEPTAGSGNLVTSGGVSYANSRIEYLTFGEKEYSLVMKPDTQTSHKYPIDIIKKAGLIFTFNVTAPAGAVVFIKKVVNGTESGLATLRNGQSATYTVEDGLERVFARQGESSDISVTIKVTLSDSLQKDINALEETVNGVSTKVETSDVIKFPFAANATFKQGIINYDFRNQIKYIRLFNCHEDRTYFIRSLYKGSGGYGLRIRERDSNGNIVEFAQIQVSNALTGLQWFKGDNVIALIDCDTVTTSSHDLAYTVAPLHNTVCQSLYSDEAHILLPSNIYCATGVNMRLFNRMCVSNQPEYEIDTVECTLAYIKHGKRGLFYTPTNETPGDSAGNVIYHTRESANSIMKKIVHFKSVRSNAGSGKTLNVLCIGASSTEQGFYVRRLKELFDNDSMSINLIGTMQDANETPGVYFEGRSGWRARTYFTSDGTADGRPARNNPFFDDTKEELATDAFNFSKYMQAQGYSGCDAVIFAFGGNDNASTEQDREYAYNYYTAMINSFKAYNPNIFIGIWLYHGGYFGYEGDSRQIDAVQSLQKYILKWFDGRESENIFVLPCGQNVDPLYDYRSKVEELKVLNDTTGEVEFVNKQIYVTDPAHPPYETGAKSLADVCYSYLKYFGTLTT